MATIYAKDVGELLKPITWFPPMWAFSCGVVASGSNFFEQAWLIVIGLILTGPLVCAASQAVNDWYDRHVDAINEPNRPIPSGRIPGRWGFRIAVFLELSVDSCFFFSRILGNYCNIISSSFGMGLQHASDSFKK